MSDDFLGAASNVLWWPGNETERLSLADIGLWCCRSEEMLFLVLGRNFFVFWIGGRLFVDFVFAAFDIRNHLK